MVELAQRYAAWKAPQADGALLLWPAADVLVEQARENNRRLTAETATVQNTPLADLRRQFRQFLGIQDDAQLAFVTGHQAELHHPGVWAKNLLIDAGATATGGTAMHVAVDTDAPKHLTIRFPGQSLPFTDDPAAGGGDWSQLVAPPTPAHLSHLSSEIAAAAKGWPFDPSIEPFLDCCRRLSLDAEHLPHLLTAALHESDWGMGLRYSALLASPLWISPPFLALAYHVLARADQFAADYNAALAAYRERNGIRTPGRPMPDLVLQQGRGDAVDRCETPFWRDDLSHGRRVRAWVERSGGHWALTAGEAALPLDPNLPADEAADALIAFLRRHNLRLSPRALMLTMTLRLLLADQFVHGIGGGQYDQVTDQIIASHYGIDPPAFAVTTATLFWPTAAGKQRTNIPALKQLGHRLRHGLLGDAKAKQVAEIDAAPRGSAERQRLFQQLQSALTEAAIHSTDLQAWDQRLRDAAVSVIEERAIFDRELFYLLQPKERLERLIDVYRGAFEGV